MISAVHRIRPALVTRICVKHFPDISPAKYANPNRFRVSWALLPALGERALVQFDLGLWTFRAAKKAGNCLGCRVSWVTGGYEAGRGGPTVEIRR